jgi:hypothetical protein
MPQDIKLNIAKNLILEGKIKEFQDIFRYLEKKYLTEKMGLNYYRLLRLVKNPKFMRFEDVYNISHALGVPPFKISELIHNQIDSKRKK